MGVGVKCFAVKFAGAGFRGDASAAAVSLSCLSGLRTRRPSRAANSRVMATYGNAARSNSCQFQGRYTVRTQFSVLFGLVKRVLAAHRLCSCFISPPILLKRVVRSGFSHEYNGAFALSKKKTNGQLARGSTSGSHSRGVHRLFQPRIHRQLTAHPRPHLCVPPLFVVVRTLRRNLSVPVSTKIRLLDSSSETVEFARRMEKAGACALTVHLRCAPIRCHYL